MTGRERVLAAMRREPVDYVPCSPVVNPLTEIQRRGKPWHFPWDPPGEGIEYLATVLQTDPVVGAWWMDGIYPDENVSSRVWLEGETLHKSYDTPAGQLHASIDYNDLWPFGRDIPFFHDFVAHYREPWLKTRNDVECLKYIFLPPRSRDQIEDMRSRFAERKALADRLQLATIATIGSGLTSALWMFGAERLCFLTVDDPELVDAYLEVEHQWTLRMIEFALEWGVDIVRRNGFYESSNYYSPEMLRQFLGKRLSKEVDTVHQGGCPIAYTMYSGVMPMLDYLADLNFDCVAHLDIVFNDIDLGTVAAALADRKSFWTGPSNTFHMYEEPDLVRQAVRDVFAAFGKTGLIITAASSIHPMMPWENTLAMIDEWRKHRDV